MKTLYVGDVYGRPGIEVVEQVLPNLKKEQEIDFVIAQGENVSGGRGLLKEDMKLLTDAGVDFFTGGNWSIFDPESALLLNDPSTPAIRPANYPDKVAGDGWRLAETKKGTCLVVSLLGNVVGRDADRKMDNPLKVIDEILEKNKDTAKVATFVNFHGDYSSQKVIIGHYLDGRVTAVIGDHWHIPTADARILPKGTAHISDVGMVGVLNSSLGVKLDVVIPRWLDGTVNRNEVETKGPRQFNALLIDSDDKTGLATSVHSIQQVFG
jgi:metallophosphoesterase (TIGR00282 family)